MNTRHSLPRLCGALVPTACLIAAAAGCSQLLDWTLVDRPSTDAGGTETAAAGEAGSAPNACDTVLVPPPPDGGSAGGTDKFVVALSTFLPIFDGDGGGVPVGLNLDRACTDSTATASCVLEGGRFTSDLPAGVDLGAKSIFDLLTRLEESATTGGAKFITAKTINDRLANGNFGLVAEVSSYNGEANDGEVALALYPAVIRTRPPPGTVSTSPNDSWTLDRSGLITVNGVVGPKFIATRAYISEMVLVAEFDAFAMDLAIQDRVPFALKLSDVHVRAQVAKDALQSRKLVQGVLAGRWSVDDFLASIGSTTVSTDQGEGQQVCLSPYLQSFLGTVCAGRDLASTPALDGKSSPCTSMGMSLSFETYSIKSRGAAGDPRDAAPPCLDASAFSCD